MAASVGSSLYSTFALFGPNMGTLFGAPLIAQFQFTEALIFNGNTSSRHFIPEPGTAALLGLGLLGMAGASRRRLRG